MKERRFYATEIGKDVTDLLVEHFPQVMDLKFTSHMEEELDQIEERKTEYRQVLDGVLGAVLDGARGGRRRRCRAAAASETGETCPQCGKPLVRNYSKKTRR